MADGDQVKGLPLSFTIRQGSMRDPDDDSVLGEQPRLVPSWTSFEVAAFVEGEIITIEGILSSGTQSRRSASVEEKEMATKMQEIRDHYENSRWSAPPWPAKEQPLSDTEPEMYVEGPPLGVADVEPEGPPADEGAH